MVEDINVHKIIDPIPIGSHNGNSIYLYFGKYGYYLKYDGKNFSLPKWVDPDELDLCGAVKIIEYKLSHPSSFQTFQ